MSLPVPLSVRIKTSTRDVHITDQISDLVFESSSPGGYNGCSIALHKPLRFTPGEVALFARLYVYAATGVVWEGRLQDPGRTADTNGEIYQLIGMGGQAHLQDRTQPYIVIDAMLERLERRQFTLEHPRGEKVLDEDSGGQPAWWLTAPTGSSWAVNTQASMVYPHIRNAGQKLGAYSIAGDCGRTTAGIWRWRTVTRSPAGVGTVDRDVDFTTVSIPGSGRRVGLSFPDGDDQLEFRIQQANAATQSPNDDTWAIFANFYVTTKLLTKAGVELGSAYSYTNFSVLANEVVEDMLGRFLPEFDGANAVVTTGTYAIEQMAYPDGVTPAQVLDDLISFDIGFTYHVWESNVDTDEFIFEWVPWPTTVRYEADSVDGFSSPASGNTIYNKVNVRYRDSRGNTRSSSSTASVPALTAAGFDRTAFIDLGDQIGTPSNAARAGVQFLQEHAAPLNAGQLVVARPILDLQTGRMVQPYEVRPGNLIRVRGVESYPDSLNRDSRDGLTVFKIAATSYSASDAAATLDLDSYAPSVARAVAALARRPLTPRR